MSPTNRRPRRRIAGERAPVARPTAVPVPTDPEPAPRAKRAERAKAAKESKRTGEPRAPRRTPSRGLVVLVLAAVLAVAGLASAAWTVADRLDRPDRTDITGEATTAARTAAEEIFNYRLDDLEAYKARAEAVMTPGYREDFADIGQLLDELAPQRRVVVSSVVQQAAPQPCTRDCDDDRVTVLVFIDQARLADDMAEPTVQGNRIVMTMVRSGGLWLVDDIRAL